MNAVPWIPTPTRREGFLEMEFRHAKERAELVELIKSESYAAGLNDRDKPGTRQFASILSQITDRVAEEYGVSVRDLRGSCRFKSLHEPRRVIWIELRSRGFSLPQIGRFFGRHYSSIYHGIVKHKKLHP